MSSPPKRNRRMPWYVGLALTVMAMAYADGQIL